MDLFSKLKGSAAKAVQQSLQFVSEVKTNLEAKINTNASSGSGNDNAASGGNTSSSSNSSNSSNNSSNISRRESNSSSSIGSSPSSSSAPIREKKIDDKKAQEDILILFHALIDDLNELETPVLVMGLNILSGGDDVEERLYSSPAHDKLKQLISLLAIEGNNWFYEHKVAIDLVNTDLSLHLPCTDTFIQTHMLHELIKRAIKDTPRGMMPLTLGFCSHLMKKVNIPLLMLPSIHKPIIRLIYNAARYEIIHRQNSSLTKSEFLLYRNRINNNLVLLLHSTWRRIRENPELIYAFSAIETKKLTPSISSSSIGTKYKPQLDILTTVLTLLKTPSTGVYAKESFLLALGIHHRLIDNYLLAYTTFIEDIINDLCINFESVLKNVGSKGFGATFNPLLISCPDLADIAPPNSDDSSRKETASSLPTNRRQGIDALKPPAPVVSSGSSSSSSSSSSKSNVFKKEPTPVELFFKNLRFCSAILSVAGDNKVDLTADFHESPDDARNGSQGVYSRLLSNYVTRFLFKTVKMAVTSIQEEQQSIALNILIRRILIDLSENRQINGRVNPFLSKFIEFLVIRGDVEQGNFTTSIFGHLIIKCGSVNKDVSITATQLISTIIKISPVGLARYIVALPSIDRKSYAMNEITKKWTSCVTNIGKEESLDTKLAKLCGALSAFSLDQSDLALGSSNSGGPGINQSSSNSTAQATVAWSPTETEWLCYSDMASGQLLIRTIQGYDFCSERGGSSIDESSSVSPAKSGVGERVCDGEHLAPSKSPASQNSEAVSFEVNVAKIRTSLLFTLIFKKLAAFSSLSLEEQLSVSTLVEKTTGLLASMAFCHLTDKCASAILLIVIDILMILDHLWGDVLRRCSKVTHLSALVTAARQLILHRDNSSSVDSNHHKIFDRETTQNKKIVETSVLLRETIVSTQSFMISLRRLRIQFQNAVKQSAIADLFADLGKGGECVNNEEKSCDDPQRNVILIDNKTLTFLRSSRGLMEGEEEKDTFEQDWETINPDPDRSLKSSKIKLMESLKSFNMDTGFLDDIDSLLSSLDEIVPPT